MNLRQYAHAIRKSWWLVALLTILGGALGYGYAASQTPLYASHLTFYVSTPSLAENANATNQFAQDRATSYAALVRSDRLAERVLDSVSLPMTPQQLSREITASAQLNTILIDVTVTDASRARGLKIAQAIGEQFPKLVASLDNNGGTSTAVRLAVVSGPDASRSPVSPRKKLDAVVGVAGGLLVGLLIAVLRDLLDVSIRSAEALREFTGVPVLATVGYDSRAKAAPLIIEDGVHSVRAESLRQLRTNLQFIDATREARVVVVTSSVEGEGKTTTAVNLALVAAEASGNVLLVEADLRKPRVSDYLGLERAVGLSNVLAGQVELSEVLQPWGSAGLVVLPSGSIPPNPSELLGSDQMISLMSELRATFKMIILDTPPLRPVTDAAVLAANADGALLVFRHGKTKRAHLQVALHALEAVNARILGCVLNMKPLSRNERRGYYAYAHTPSHGIGTRVRSVLSPASSAPTRAQSSSSRPTRDGGGAQVADANRSREESGSVETVRGGSADGDDDEDGGKRRENTTDRGPVQAQGRARATAGAAQRRARGKQARSNSRSKRT